MQEDVNDDQGFFITAMPASRPADYYLGYLEGCVFMDFDNYGNDRIRLVRISFDGYGCCNLGTRASLMDGADSKAFKEMIETELLDQDKLTAIVKKTILNNRQLIWEDALKEYNLL